MNTPIANKAINLMRSTSTNKLENNECSLFGKQIEIQLWKIASLYVRIVMQNAINNVLFETETGKFSSPININTHHQDSSLYGFIPNPSFTAI